MPDPLVEIGRMGAGPTGSQTQVHGVPYSLRFAYDEALSKEHGMDVGVCIMPKSDWEAIPGIDKAAKQLFFVRKAPAKAVPSNEVTQAEKYDARIKNAKDDGTYAKDVADHKAKEATETGTVRKVPARPAEKATAAAKDADRKRVAAAAKSQGLPA